jgi:hypothetical protein
VTRRELGTLLGTSDRSIQRTLASDDPVAPTPRLVAVARLVALLRRGWTAEGVLAWFERPRRALGGDTPLVALGRTGREEDVMALARAGRAQHGS